MSGMGVALTVLGTHSLIISSHPPAENHCDILPVETRCHPSINRLRGPPLQKLVELCWLTVRTGGGGGWDRNYLVLPPHDAQ